MRLVVHAEATREFYDKEAGDNSNPKYRTLRDATNITANISRDGNGDNPRVTLTLDNAYAQTQGRFLTPPIGRRAELYNDDGLVFDGVIDFVSGGPSYTVQVQADADGSSYLDNIALRTTAVWGTFKQAEVIPWRYGTTTGRCLQYDNTRRLFVWADHASNIITEVRVNDQINMGWEWKNAPDSTGSPCTFIEFTQPVEEGAEVVATGRGKVSTQTGIPIENPADVLADVLGIDEDLVSAFRAECEGYVVSGELDEFVSAQTAANEICQSFGAVFSPLMAGLARVYPEGSASSRTHPMPKEPVVDCNSSIDAVANVIVMDFDYRNGEAKQSIEIEAPDSIERFGRRERRIEAKWIADGRVAIAVATKALQKDARANWQITVNDVNGRVLPGDTITLDHAVLPVTGSGFVESGTYDPKTNTTTVSTSVPVGSVPRVRLVRQSQGIEADQVVNIAGGSSGDEYELLISHPDGKVASNAKVVLDGQITSYSDGSGRVTFPNAAMTPGSHSLEVTPVNGPKFTVTIPV